jgi:hypothetical protein
VKKKTGMLAPLTLADIHSESTFNNMSSEADPLALLGLRADEQLLGADSEHLPAAVGDPPEPLPESPARRRVVRLGASMTGVTLIGGVAMALVGLIELIANGSLVWLVMLVLGLLLAATHWGWVHVAELTGNTIEARRNASVAELQRHWLEQIEPYARWEVSTSAGEDGSITILTTCIRPVPRGERTFTFVRDEVGREVHGADEPAAAVAERAELMRRQAAAKTVRAREEFEAARNAYDETLMVRDDEQQRRAALQAASQALSERINTHLRDPPLTE